MKYCSILIFCLLLSQAAFSNDKAIQITGDVGAVLLPTAAIISAIAHRDGEGSWQFVKAFGVGIATTYILKVMVKRERPNEHDDWSFPSAHTQIAFNSAAFLQRRYGWKYGVPSYLAATYVGFTRVKTKWHWTSDVVAGAVIGIVSNFLFTKRYQKNITITPYVAAHNTFGIAVQIKTT